MKRFFIVLIAILGIGLIGYGFSAHSEGSHPQANIESSPKDCNCPKCEVKLEKYQKAEKRWYNCSNCKGEGRVTCAVKEWQDCEPCRGTGCKDGYTTDNGKYCAYGQCNTCKGKGGKEVNVLKKNACDCTAMFCEYNSEAGRYGQYKTGSYYTVLKCPRCDQEYNGCD